MFFKSSGDFEQALFGVSSGPFKEREYKCFDDSFKEVVCGLESNYPKTRLGESLFFLLKAELEKLGIDTRGLALFSTIGTEIDAFHGADGIICVPSLDWAIVTLDVFNLSERREKQLRDQWIDQFPGNSYLERDHQWCLYHYKQGRQIYMKGLEKSGKKLYEDVARRMKSFERPEDFRMRVMDKIKWRGNHYVMTPQHVTKVEFRRNFARNLALYFEGVKNRLWL